MFNIDYIRDNKEEYLSNLRKRGLNIDLDIILKLYDEKTVLQRNFDDIQKKRNDIAKLVNSGSEPKDKLLKDGKDLKIKSLKVQKDLKKKSDLLLKYLSILPNRISNDMPEGIDEKGNVEIKKVGKIPNFDFEIKDHIELGIKNDLLDFEKSSKVSGSNQ